MSRITFTAEESHKDYLTDLEERDNIDSTAAAVRYCIEVTAEAQQHDAELQQHVEELQQEVDRLQNEKRTLINDRQEKQELVEYVETEKSLSERKAQAGVITRAKWWLTGMPAEK